MQKFVSNRDLVLRSIHSGMAIEFKKGVPTELPKSMHKEALDKGILPVEEDGSPVDPETQKVGQEEPVKIVLPPDSAEVRDAKILEVIKEIIKRNNSKDFTGSGAPAARAVQAALGWHVDQKEVRKVWDENKAELLSDNKGE